MEVQLRNSASLMSLFSMKEVWPQNHDNINYESFKQVNVMSNILKK